LLKAWSLTKANRHKAGIIWDDYQAIIIVACGYSLAMLSGFFRQMALAEQLGAGQPADIFLVAFALPEFIYIALPIVLLPAVIPVFARFRQEYGENAEVKLCWYAARRISFGFTILSLVLGIFTPLFISWLSPGFNSSQKQQAILVTWYMLPAISFMGLGSLMSAALQVHRNFTISAFVTSAYNLTFVAALYLFPVESSLTRAAFGVTLGALMSVFIQVPSLLKYKNSRLHFNSSGIQKVDSSLFHREYSRIVHLALPLLAGYAIHHLILLVDRAMATSLGTGSAAMLDYANHLALVGVQISGLSVSTVIFPGLSEQLAAGNVKEAKRKLLAALRFVGFLAVPIYISLILLRQPVVKFLFERGAFDRVATQAVSAALVWYAVAMLADSFCQPLWRILYAQQSNWRVLEVNCIQTIIRFAGNLILIPSMGALGLAVSASIGLLMQLIILSCLVLKEIGDQPHYLWQQNNSK
jgi:putative peptidoglycan lipid II flippase